MSKKLLECKSLQQCIFYLLNLNKPYFCINTDDKNYIFNIIDTLSSGFKSKPNNNTQNDLHKSLYLLYSLHMTNFSKYDNQFDPLLIEIRNSLEHIWISYESERVLDCEIPLNPKEFILWFKNYIQNLDVTEHRVYDYIDKEASVAEIKYHLSQEASIDARFDDLMALAQVGVSNPKVKLELAQNYWDEMGNGTVENMHGVIFSSMLKELNILSNDKTMMDLLIDSSWQSLACANVVHYGVLHRSKFNFILGVFGAIESVGQIRFAHLVNAYKRVSFEDKLSYYHTLHVEVDKKHSDDWFNNAIYPIVEMNQNAVYEIYLGGSIVMNASQYYCEHLLEVYNIS